MAISYYDDAIVHKLKTWIPDNSPLRVLGPSESKNLFETKAYDSDDAAPKLPIIALSRKPEIELRSNIKQNRSFDGLRIVSHGNLSSGVNNGYEEPTRSAPGVTVLMNTIPIRAEYQLDIYTKTQEECEEYVRNFLFKLINNPLIVIEIPYNNMDIRHTANLRVLPNVADTSDITERIFVKQFHRWTIQFELQDGFLFSIPYKRNWTFIEPGIEMVDKINQKETGIIEQVSQLDDDSETDTENSNT